MTQISGVALGPGNAVGPALKLDEPLSFWGGVNPETGEIIDRHHPQSGRNVSGVILVLRHSRGSSGTPSVLAEGVRSGTGPAGIILQEPDPMFVIGSLVIAELYPERSCPVVVVGDAFDRLIDRSEIRIEANGLITQRV